MIETWVIEFPVSQFRTYELHASSATDTEGEREREGRRLKKDEIQNYSFVNLEVGDKRRKKELLYTDRARFIKTLIRKIHKVGEKRHSSSLIPLLRPPPPPPPAPFFREDVALISVTQTHLELLTSPKFLPRSVTTFANPAFLPPPNSPPSLLSPPLSHPLLQPIRIKMHPRSNERDYEREYSVELPTPGELSLGEWRRKNIYVYGEE